MSIANKLLQIAENEPKVFEAGRAEGYAQGFEAGKAEGGDPNAFEEGRVEGRKDVWDDILDSGARTNMRKAFAYWGATEISPPYRITAEDFSEAFRDCLKLKTIDWSKFVEKPYGTCYMAFHNCLNLESVDIVLSPTANPPESFYSNTFNGCEALESIKQLGVTENMAFSLTFNSCKNLSSLTVDGVIGKTINLKSCPLDLESAKSVITHLKNFIGTDGAWKQTVYFSDYTWGELNSDTSGTIWGKYISDTLGWNF